MSKQTHCNVEQEEPKIDPKLSESIARGKDNLIFPVKYAIMDL